LVRPDTIAGPGKAAPADSVAAAINNSRDNVDW